MNTGYEVYGFDCRLDYLNFLAKSYNVSLDFVYTISTPLGASEDFDQLIHELTRAVILKDSGVNYYES